MYQHDESQIPQSLRLRWRTHGERRNQAFYQKLCKEPPKSAESGQNMTVHGVRRWGKDCVHRRGPSIFGRSRPAAEAYYQRFKSSKLQR